MTGTVKAAAALLILLSGAAAAADAAVSLAPAQSRRDDERVWPYRAAELTVKNESDRIVRAVALRWVGGGPTMIYPATIPPQSGQTIPVSLPAVAVEQWYDVRLLAEDSPDADVVAEFEAPITWPLRPPEPPVDDDFDRAFIDPYACEQYAFDVPQWSNRARANVLIAAALAALAMAATLFVRRRAVRLVLLAATIAAATAAIHEAVLPRDVVVQRVLSQGSDLPIYAAGPGDSLYVVAARRTSHWTHPDARLAPIYYNRLDMAEDTMVVHADRGISVPLRPGLVRLFRLRR